MIDASGLKGVRTFGTMLGMVLNLLPQFYFLGDFPVATYGVFYHLGAMVFFALYWRALRDYLATKQLVTVLGIIFLCGYLVLPLTLRAARGSFGNSAFYSLATASMIALIYCHFQKIRFLQLADRFVVPSTLAFGIMKLGCLFAGCCYGLPTDGYFFVSYGPQSGAPFLPAVLREQAHWQGLHLEPVQAWVAGLLFFIAALAHFSKKTLITGSGYLSVLGLALYSAGRALIEARSGSDVLWFEWQPNQVMGIVGIGLSLGILFYSTKIHKQGVS